MKYIFSLFLFLIPSILLVEAQESKPKATYLNFNYTKSKLKFDNEFSINNDFGGGITVGRTFYLHKKPIAGMLRFGLDWTFFDLNVSQYSEEDYDEEDGEFKVKTYMGEVGMHFGPSVTVTPVKNLNVSAYFRYAPSFVGFYNDDMEEFKGAFGSFFVTGISASYRMISLGVEQRWGAAKFKFSDDEDDDYEYEDISFTMKTKTTGPRFYIGLRF